MATTAELEKRIRALEERLEKVEAVRAIERLKARYGELADLRYAEPARSDRTELERLADQIALLFTEDAVWDGGKALGLCSGRDAIRQRFSEPTLAFAWHFFVKPQIKVDGERASATWDILAPCTTLDGTPHWMAGAEDDEYRRVDGLWLHSRMSLRVVFMAPHAEGWKKR